MKDVFKLHYGSETSQYGVLYVPEGAGNYPLVVIFHGGFWKMPYDLDQINPLAEDLTARGYAVWNVEYRRVGESGGGWDGTFQDAADAVNFLLQVAAKYSLDLTRVAIIGHSAGGHLALWLASRANKISVDGLGCFLKLRPKGVISLAGVLDLRGMWNFDRIHKKDSPVANFLGGSPEEFPERYQAASPIEQLPIHIDQLLIHGSLDQEVPLLLSREYYRRAVDAEDNVQLVVIPQTDHFMLIDPHSLAWQSVLSGLEQWFEV